MPSTLSVIIPTLNEAASLQALLPCLVARENGRELVEVIVVDGGSADDTVQIARHAGLKVVVTARPGRAHQLNKGALEARGELLLFLHADTFLPLNFFRLLQDTCAQGALGGAFSRRFQPGSRFLNLTCRLADWRGRSLGWFLGDQAIFARKEAFLRLGGFRALRAFEDLDFSMRISSLGPTALIDVPVFSSDRRFQRRGSVRQTLSDLILTLRFFANESSFYEAGPR